MNQTRYVVAFSAMLALAVAGSVVVEAQRRSTRKGGRNSGQQSLGEPFRGVSANNKIQDGLFKIESTGVSTKPVVDAAKAFLAGVSDEQRDRTTFDVDDIEWRSWDNRHFYKRKGIGFDDLGLLIIDEEHRFGVKQKEHIKRLNKFINKKWMIIIKNQIMMVKKQGKLLAKIRP